MSDPLNFDLAFEVYWEILTGLGREYNEPILDRDGWREPFDRGLSAAEAFCEEFPEHK